MNDSDYGLGKGATPISAHPVFPLVVATWFAALLGIGSLMLPIALFENLFAATGLASIVPAAQAPLGTTARVAICGAAALAGAVAGWLIAVRIGRSHRRQAPRSSNIGSHRAQTGKKPILAREELGSDSLDEPVVSPFAPTPPPSTRYQGKWRAVAVTDDSRASECHESAPLPGRLDMEDCDDEPENEPSAERTRETAPDQFDDADEPARTEPEPKQEPLPKLVPASAPEPGFAPATVFPGRPVTDRPLSDLGIVELVERFAIALQNHAPVQTVRPDARSEIPALDNSDSATPMVFRGSHQDDDASVAEPVASGNGELPAALRMPHFDDGEELDEEDATAPFTLPFGRMGDRNPDPAPSPINNPLHANREFVRIDDDASPPPMPQPARPFDAPGSRPASADRVRSPESSGDTEKALRQALDQLQRMSGAA